MSNLRVNIRVGKIHIQIEDGAILPRFSINHYHKWFSLPFVASY